MEEKEMALAISERFIQMDDEIRALRAVLSHYWNHETPFEAFVQKGIQQLQVRRKEAQGSFYPDPEFPEDNDGSSLLKILHQHILRKTQV